MSRLPGTDEQRHLADAHRWWSETWCFEFWCPDDHDSVIRGVGGYVALTLLPNQRRAWYWSALVGPGRPLVALSDLHVPLSTRTLEIRSEGLWADHICEEPVQRWTIGNESFAVALDDPAVALGDARGTLTPFGVDLEWEAIADPDVVGAGDGYEIAAQVHGEVLVASERLDITADGRWWHRWGHHSWGSMGSSSRAGDAVIDGLRAPVRIETDDEVLALELSLGPDGWRSSLRPLSRLDDGDRTRRPPATS